MNESVWPLIGAAFLMLIAIGGICFAGNHYSLGNIKSRTVGDGQHGTARWATRQEIARTYTHVPFVVEQWRRGINLPQIQGIVVGSEVRRRIIVALVDSDDIHCLMIGASGVGKTAFFLYPNLEYTCASGMSFLALDSKGDLARNYGAVASKYYGYARALCADPDITLNRQVFLSEMESCDRNRAIAYLLKSKGIITANVDNSIELYTKLCALNVTAESLASFALLLSNGGISPATGQRLLKPETVRTVLSIMLTCGMYDGSGRFAAEVGVPTKSGVGGGLMAAVHGRAGIGIYGPALDPNGNCAAGCAMMRYLSRELGLHMFQKGMTTVQ